MNNSGPSPEAIMAILAAYVGVILGFVCLVAIIQGVICWFLSTCIQKIPEGFRQVTPGAPWLFMLGFVPCIGGIFVAVFNFMFWPKLSSSFKSYFDSTGQTEVGDCGAQLASIYCIVSAIMHVVSFLGMIPYIGLLISMANCLLGPAALILLIILLVKAGTYKAMIPDQVDNTPEFPITNA